MPRTRCPARAAGRRPGPSRIRVLAARAYRSDCPGGPESCWDGYLAQQGHDLFGVQVQESPLIVARRVEHQVIEAQVDIEPDLLDVLFRISRDDPAAGRALGRQGVRQALHL